MKLLKFIELLKLITLYNYLKGFGYFAESLF